MAPAGRNIVLFGPKHSPLHFEHRYQFPLSSSLLVSPTRASGQSSREFQHGLSKTKQVSSIALDSFNETRIISGSASSSEMKPSWEFVLTEGKRVCGNNNTLSRQLSSFGRRLLRQDDVNNNLGRERAN